MLDFLSFISKSTTSAVIFSDACQFSLNNQKICMLLKYNIWTDFFLNNNRIGIRYKQKRNTIENLATSTYKLLHVKVKRYYVKRHFYIL